VVRRAELARVLYEHRRAVARRERALIDLTSSELGTLQGLVDGLSVDEMARMRTVSSSTVRSHVRAILRKLGAHSQIEAVSIAAKAGMEPRESLA
jgi:DNA-binding NarL/FixJ family response regulator